MEGVDRIVELRVLGKTQIRKAEGGVGVGFPDWNRGGSLAAP